MSWEVVSRARHPCPCGKGEYEETTRENDWFQSEITREMLCPECNDRYTYDRSVVGGHPGDEIERGWVLKSVLEAERNFERQVMATVREFYLDLWHERFAHARTKKQVWEVFTKEGTYYPSLGTFYKHTKEFNRTQLMRHVDSDFSYFHNLHNILAVCGIIPQWEALGIVTGGTCELCGSEMARGHELWVCRQCGYRRPRLPNP